MGTEFIGWVLCGHTIIGMLMLSFCQSMRAPPAVQRIYR